MAAKDLGTRFCCYKCTTKFYDLKKPEPICPKCSANQKDDPALKGHEPKKTRIAALPKIVEPIEPADGEAAEAGEDEIDDLPEDAEFSPDEDV